MAYEPWSAERAAAIIAEHAGQEGATLVVLHALQARFGCVPLEAERMIAASLNLSRAEVHGIVSFYHDFRREPPGRHVLRLCRAEACQAVGGAAVADQLRERLGIDWHQTTPDGTVTLEPAFCLGLCAIGPSALLDGQPIGRLTADKAATLVEAT